MATPLLSTPALISTTQMFSRRGIGHLWNNRNDLDPGQVSIINSIYNNRKKGAIECSQATIYKLSNKKAGKLGWGRYYGSKGSLETLEKECRGTLCSEYYHDIDIVNCHFVLLTQFAKNKYNKDLPEVDRYVADRELFFKEVGGSRDDAKQEIIRIMYGGQTKNEFLIPLSKETREISKFLSIQPDYLELFNACKNEDNVYGSFLSFILQTEERKCMLLMKNTLERIGWNVDVLCYDGVMIRKNPKHDINESLRVIVKDSKEKLGYDIQVVEKAMSFFNLPELTEELCANVSREKYDVMKQKFEETNFYYAPANEMVQVRGRDLLRMTLEHAREYYSAEWRFSHSKKFEDYTPFFDLWRKDATRRIIQRIDMKESDDPSVFVMPPIFAWHEEGPKSSIAVEKFCEIISLLGNDEQQKYIVKWLAQMIQNPFEKVGTGLVITGEKRTGKDTPFDFFREYVIGMDYTRNYTCGGSQFFDKHDVGRMNMFFCKIEEANRKIFIANADKFKPLITADSEMFNDKGRKPMVVANYNRFLLTTNGACPVEMGDGEQRFIVAACSSIRKHDTDYWGDVRKVLFNKEAGRAVGEWLSEIDLSGFNFRILPQDEFQNMIVESEMRSEELFVRDWDGVETEVSEFFNKYRSYCVENNLPYCKNAISLGISLQKLVRNKTIIKENISSKEHKNRAVYYKP